VKTQSLGNHPAIGASHGSLYNTTHVTHHSHPVPRPRREQLGAALFRGVALALRCGLAPLEHAALINDIGFGAPGTSRAPERLIFEAVAVATTNRKEQHHNERVDGPKDSGIRQVGTGHAAIAAAVVEIVLAASVAAVHLVEDAAE